MLPNQKAPANRLRFALDLMDNLNIVTRYVRGLAAAELYCYAAI